MLSVVIMFSSHRVAIDQQASVGESALYQCRAAMGSEGAGREGTDLPVFQSVWSSTQEVNFKSSQD